MKTPLLLAILLISVLTLAMAISSGLFGHMLYGKAVEPVGASREAVAATAQTAAPLGNAAGFPNATPITEYGPILIHGETYKDRWRGTTNTPPTDGSINAWSYFPDGGQIITKGDTYWYLANRSTTWITGSLKQRWANCTNFPATGVDSYSVRPETWGEYAMKGRLMFNIARNGSCQINGVDWKSQWAAVASPSGDYPLKNTSKIIQFAWISRDAEIFFTNDGPDNTTRVWLWGANPSTLGCSGPLPPSRHFCNPQTLAARYSKYEDHPPLDRIGIFAQSSNPYFQIFTYGEYVWTFGLDKVSTFRSGFDGYGARDVFINKFDDTYYLYYDSMDGRNNWVTAVATAPHPKGPWTKQGEVKFTGTVRPWEKVCSCASTVYEVNGKYYNFYLGADSYRGDDLSPRDPVYERYRIPRPSDGQYYRMGLAVSDSPFGPFKRLKGDGTLANAAYTDQPLVKKPTSTSNWHYSFYGSAMGSFINDSGQLYILYTDDSKLPASRNGIGMMKARNNSVLGPWDDLSYPVISPTQYIENAGLVYDPNSRLYLLFGNAFYGPTVTRWKDYVSKPCVVDKGLSIGIGLAMYWSPKLDMTWDGSMARMIAMGQKDFMEKKVNGQITCVDNGNYTLDPNNLPTQHRGRVGLGFPIIVPEENRVYVVFDGTDFVTNNYRSLGAMYRNIYLLSIDLPTAG